MLFHRLPLIQILLQPPLLARLEDRGEGICGSRGFSRFTSAAEAEMNRSTRGLQRIRHNCNEFKGLRANALQSPSSCAYFSDRRRSTFFANSSLCDATRAALPPRGRGLPEGHTSAQPTPPPPRPGRRTTAWSGSRRTTASRRPRVPCRSAGDSRLDPLRRGLSRIAVQRTPQRLSKCLSSLAMNLPLCCTGVSAGSFTRITQVNSCSFLRLVSGIGLGGQTSPDRSERTARSLLSEQTKIHRLFDPKG
jgi:hypothetical protein